jgi:hypothetical protein
LFSVHLFLVIQKIVHLTAAVLSVVYISNSESSLKCVAFVQIVPADKASFTILLKLLSEGKSSLFKVKDEFSSSIDTEPSEKKSSFVSPAVVLIVSHSL